MSVLPGLLEPGASGGAGPILAVAMTAAAVVMAWRVLRMALRIALLVAVAVVVLHVLTSTTLS